MTEVSQPQSPRVRIAPRGHNSSVKIEKNRPAMIETAPEEKGMDEIINPPSPQSPEELANKAINTLDIEGITIQNSKPIVAIIHNKRYQAMTIGMMDVAKQCDAAARAVLAKVGSMKEEASISLKYNDLEQKLTAAQNDYDQLKLRWDQVISNAEKNKIKELETLQKENEKELADLDSTFNGDPPPSFKKLSPKIVELRHTIYVTGKSGNLKEASRLKQMLEEMIEQEKAQNREEWKAVFHIERDELEKSLDQKYQLRIEQLDRDLIKMNRYRDRELLRAQRSIDHLQEKLDKLVNEPLDDSPRIPRAPQTARVPRRNMFFKNKSSSIIIPKRGAISKPSTPRTPRKRANYASN
ncbi:hypothetical protein TVAG_410050 [Trichomonas vaginalis G3]|uniref:Uncharacterized protein n=1 Tax=Trichomonas vaginalis (strain ATCC PRA-98 / G3) TaxID=412133 RepID=A2E8H5_TRIV3|nr:hypothetical protein TVAGG3_0359040 [Trichomonas vaginalis G3]EAY11012.1 hypothetical protein TVAG_410050 [Trichomonas vaginalis G3]KAI5531814.1 hypothetical protein TVAGG3_0359040 [Trichomonas vaginalis G3]|eukprot:XP_001323235.1 hypothetical protein [Trichomonas vaginalis G3]